MSWSSSQVSRLGIEKQLLEKYFSGRITWNNPTSVDGNIDVKMTSNKDNSYIIRVYLGEDFPNSCPTMVLVSPKNPKLQNGSALPSVSSEFHTIGEQDGFTMLCHFMPELWTADNTLYQVFMKGRLWIAAYEGHLDTGKNMDVFLKEQTSDDENDQILNDEDIPSERVPRRKDKNCVIL